MTEHRPIVRPAGRRGVAAVGLVGAALAVLLAGCSASDQPTPAPSDPEPEPLVTEPEREPWVSLIATANVRTVEVFDGPGSSTPVHTVAAADAVSYPDATSLTFLVLDDADSPDVESPDSEDTAGADAAGYAQSGRLQVLLPGPVEAAAEATPGALLDLPTGWVRASDVTVAATDYRVEVRLGDGRLLVHQADDVVLDVPVQVGPAAPRPGRTFLTELVTPASTDGPYGVFAYGLAGYPTALVGFGNVDGLVGIHGGADDAEPDSAPPAGSGADPDTGAAAEPGSVGLADADVTRLVEELGLPLGTPVDVVA